MNTADLESKGTSPTREIRGPELGSALKRDRFLQRVSAARKRLSPIPSSMARLR
ncbi:MAG: hypothetical protein QOF06_781 [Solirubrobacterales bacterium]|jgi:hypothetical protein|nr:hypothetical protein [Solirubrobacterales bacterium]